MCIMHIKDTTRDLKLLYQKNVLGTCGLFKDLVAFAKDADITECGTCGITERRGGMNSLHIRDYFENTVYLTIYKVLLIL